MIVLITGPPGAGKTTVAEALQEGLAAAGTDVRFVDSDEFSRRTDERLAERVAGPDADWLVTGTFYRSEFFAPFERFEDVIVVHLWCDLDTFFERNRRRGGPIDEEAVHIIWREFDRPDGDVVGHTTDTSVQEVVDELVSRFSVETGGA